MGDRVKTELERILSKNIKDGQIQEDQQKIVEGMFQEFLINLEEDFNAN